MRHLTAPRKICSSFETVSAALPQWIYEPCPDHRTPPEEVSRSSEDVPLSAVRISGFLRISDFELRIFLSCRQNRTAKRDASNDYGDCGDYGEYADCGDYGDCSDYGD
jgi:hypothetical protein